MRSRHADEFNHDPWAESYDAKVRDETNPIRTGYAALLAWTLENAHVDADAVVLDLGAGTGNTAAGIRQAARVIAVDVSEKMLAQAGAKLAHLPRVDLIQADLLEVFEQDLPPIDAIVSTYSVHHLTEEEKAELFVRAHDALRPGGSLVLGDLMFESASAKAELAAAWSEDDRAQILKSVEEEFPFSLDHALPALAVAGLEVQAVKRFSDLSWGIAALRPAS